MNLELASTNDLIDELHKRSQVFIYAMRPLVKSPDQTHDFICGCSTDGGRTDQPERLARGFGLMTIVTAFLCQRAEEQTGASDESES